MMFLQCCAVMLGISCTTDKLRPAHHRFRFFGWDIAGASQVEGARSHSAFDCGTSTGQHWASRGTHPISASLLVFTCAPQLVLGWQRDRDPVCHLPASG